MTIYYNIEPIMDKSEDKIIVFESYDTVMAANLAKTKLDAYGIPCFLSDENFVGLYPIRNDLFPGVRLHIFEMDQEKVKEILHDEQIGETEVTHCSSCQSKNVEVKASRKGLVPEFITSIMTGMFLHPKETYHCNDCGNDFNSISDLPKSSGL